MPLRVRRWAQARLDIRDIWLTVAEQNMRAADAVLDDFDAKIAMLAEYPEAGRIRDDLHRGLRQFPSSSYLIFYTLNAGVLEVRRVMHDARDIGEEMFEYD